MAYRSEDDGDPLVVLISRRQSKKWGIPKGKFVKTPNFAENAAKEAFEEAWVIGYISSVRLEKDLEPPIQHTIEVWIYLLEVAELTDTWPEKGKREIRWVTCEAAAQYLRQPVLAHLCHRLVQG